MPIVNLTLDRDVRVEVERMAREQSLSVGQALSDLMRETLRREGLLGEDGLYHAGAIERTRRSSI